MFDRRNKLTRNILLYRGSGSTGKIMSNIKNKLVGSMMFDKRNKPTINILFYRGSGSVGKLILYRRNWLTRNIIREDYVQRGKECLTQKISSREV